jgi:hypothetical protein
MPIGSISMGDYEDSIFVRLRNDGAGPMIVDDIAVFGNDEKVGSALIDLMPRGLLWTTFVKDISGRAFASGKDIDLISISGDIEDPKFLDARRSVREALSTLSIRANYHSVYGDKQHCQRSLDWFGASLITPEMPQLLSLGMEGNGRNERFGSSEIREFT